MAKVDKKEMTVTEGLAQLKLLDKRIKKSTRGSIVGHKVGSTIQDNFNESEAKANFQSLKDLIDRRASLKMAINASNLSTKVKIGGKKMTVLEAIEFKKTIEYKKSILSRMLSDFSEQSRKVEYGNDETKERLDTQVRSAFEKATKKEIEDFSTTFNRNNGYSLVDPLGIEKLATDLDEEIDNFESEVDFVLSTSNATTTISV